jgi:CBS domain containing-hemolysin-like protein
LAALVAPVIDLLSRFSTPAVWLLDASSRLVLRLLGSEAQPRETVTDVAVHGYETSRSHQAAWARPSWSARTWAGVR